MSSQAEKKSVFQHIALSVSNLKRSVAFYQEVFGFRIILTVEFKDEAIGRVIGYPGARCRMIQLENEGQMLELFEYTSPKGQSIPSSKTQADIGFSHICFIVDDIDDFREKFRKQGQGLAGDKVKIRRGVFVQYCFGPDRETIELKEMKN